VNRAAAAGSADSERGASTIPNRPAEQRRRVLVAGGDADPNLAALLATLRKRGDSCLALLVGPETHPRLAWIFESDVLEIDGTAVDADALFVRHDVFAALSDPRPAPAYRALGWYTTLVGWATSHASVRMFNARSALEVTNKLNVLRIAREAGLPSPRTVVTNDRRLLEPMVTNGGWITKPVNGGDYARLLADVLKNAPHRDGAHASPAIVQEQLVPPEVRVYSIAGRFFAFQLIADALDYRSTADCRVVPLDVAELPSQLIEGLQRLMERLRMDFGAADFKASPESGELQFLEINNGPMFAAFDSACDGRLTDAMAEWLTTS